MSVCPHVVSIGDTTWNDIIEKHKTCNQCEVCAVVGGNLWLCIVNRCYFIGCDEGAMDDIHTHKENSSHELIINLSSLRIYCFKCKSEVIKGQNTPPLSFAMPNSTSYDSVGSNIERRRFFYSRGLVGLHNIGNTCYVNAAIQALSNCAPFCQYFLNCTGHIRRLNIDRCRVSYTFMHLLQSMWSPTRLVPCLSPVHVINAIRSTNHMFGANMQQDTHEFLLCLLNQLHDELKMSTSSGCRAQPKHAAAAATAEADTAEPDGSASCPSDTDYETCDSSQSADDLWTEEEFSVSDSDKDEEQWLMSSENVLQKVATCEPGDDPDKAGTSKSHGINSSQSTDSGFSLGSAATGMPEAAAAGTQALRRGPNRRFTRHTSFHTAHTSDNTLSAPLAAVDSPRSARCQRPSDLSTGCETMECKVPYILPCTTNRKTLQSSPEFSRESGSSVVSDVFGGQTVNLVQCLTCKMASQRTESFEDLSIPIARNNKYRYMNAMLSCVADPCNQTLCESLFITRRWFWWLISKCFSWMWHSSITLHDCLRSYFCPEELVNENAYKCDNCDCLRAGVKLLKISKLPEILCIHLKRFNQINAALFAEYGKLSEFVEFPLENLDMAEYVHSDNSPADKNQSTVYDLVAVICHQGTVRSGHYCTFALSEEEQMWYMFNDRMVLPVEHEFVQLCEAYVLFYRRRSAEMNALRCRRPRVIDYDDADVRYVSLQWMHKFETFTDPGPITNCDFLCPHEAVDPKDWRRINEFTTAVPTHFWQLLRKRFGGGPEVDQLEQCPKCLAALEALKQRQQHEMDTFVKLNGELSETGGQGEAAAAEPPVSNAIDAGWFNAWQKFVSSETEDNPGPIDNRTLSNAFANQLSTRPVPSSKYVLLSHAMWYFLQKTYGGGPAVRLPLIPVMLSIQKIFPSVKAAAVSCGAREMPNGNAQQPETADGESQDSGDLVDSSGKTLDDKVQLPDSTRATVDEGSGTQSDSIGEISDGNVQLDGSEEMVDGNDHEPDRTREMLDGNAQSDSAGEMSTREATLGSIGETLDGSVQSNGIGEKLVDKIQPVVQGNVACETLQKLEECEVKSPPDDVSCVEQCASSEKHVQ